MEPGETVAQTLVRLRVRSVNISLDTLDRENYQPGRKMVGIGG
jgi:molybdenum cofactor biosynthesis enzyme MoaA